MQFLLFLSAVFFMGSGCQNSAGTEKTSVNIPVDTAHRLRVNRPPSPLTKDTVPQLPLPRPYTSLVFDKTELLKAAPGTKSVLFNGSGSKLYAMNLEGMSVYEFDQASRKINKEYKFKATKGTGWDYAKEKPIPSYEEKPVEACLSHDDKILWISLHNAEGIVPIRVDSIDANRRFSQLPDSINRKQISKKITVVYPGSEQKDSFNVPLIKTGKTPKIIARTADNKYLLVSNWHSYTVSILEMDKDLYPYAKLLNNVSVSSIPRGIVVDDKNHRSYVAIMGGASITVINNTVWMKETEINVESNPRHIVMDTSNHLFVSYNKLAKIACIDASSGKTLFTAATHAQPRTIILSKNHKFLFVTCYSSDTVDVFKINDNSFSKIASLPCKGHPVGVDVFENDDKLEAWVCSYSNGSISVFSFVKK